MAHPNVAWIEKDDRQYSTFKGKGWYFVDPQDPERLNIEGPYANEELAEREYFAFCAAAHG